ncbi:holliday junction resolvase [Gordonia phage RedWattleHog]|nr:holliday junction resolvase [Gordonia phage RedWattleHog]
MPSKEYRTHCKDCGEKITDGTQHVTCAACRKPMTPRVIATCPCGQPAQNLRSKYCGADCRRKWGRKPPLRMVDHVCLCCGKSFTLPWNYPSKGKYCSNACAHRQMKKVRDKFIADLPDGAVVFHSGWEIRYWAMCLRRDIPIRSYDGPDIETSQGVYRPDFIVGNGTVVDVKGWMRPESQIKIDEARDQGVDVQVVDRETLVALEGADETPMSPVPIILRKS